MERQQLIELVDGLEKVYSSSPLLAEEALEEIKNILEESELKVPTREQVEKAWKGEWGRITDAYGKVEGFLCKCGTQTYSASNFCPDCGRPMTDEAVDIVMKRLEEMRNG